MNRNILVFVSLVCSLGVSGCSNKGEVEKLSRQLKQASEEDQRLRAEMARMKKEAERLKSNFSAYAENPCGLDLDPVAFSIKNKSEPGECRVVPKGPAPTGPAPVVADPPKNGGKKGPTRHGMGAAMKPGMKEPAGPPAQLKDIHAKARRARRGIRKCYTSALKRDASLQMGGRRVTLKFTVQPSGRMSRIMVIPPIGSGFEGCVRGLLNRWSFSKFRGPAQKFSVPMNLRPQ